MSTYSDQVLKHYANAGPGILERLGKALDEAEAAPVGTPVGVSSHPAGGAMASEAAEIVRVCMAGSEDAAADTVLAAAPLRSDIVLDAVTKRIALTEGTTYGEARTLAAKRFPKVRARYLLQED